MCPQYLMDKRSTQSRDRRGLQRSLHFLCKSLGFMFSLLENMKAHIYGGRIPCMANWVHTVATRWVAYEGDVWVLLTMDSYQQQSIKVSLLKLAWDRISFEMNLSFCYQIVGFSRNKTAHVFFTLVGDPNNAERRFLGLFEISFLVLS